MIFGMNVPESSSPKRLACWAGVGSALVASSILTVFMPIPRLSGADDSAWAFLWKDLLRLLACFVPFLIGIVILSRAERRLSRGIKNDLWTDEELEPLRRRLAHPAWTIVSLLFIAAFIGNAIVYGGFTLVWALIVPVQQISRLRMMLKTKQVAGGGLQDWRNFKPIQSEHWGESRSGPLSS
jgi:hypothetical protein